MITREHEPLNIPTPEHQRSPEQVNKEAFSDALAEYAYYIENNWHIPHIDKTEEEIIKEEILPEFLEIWTDKYNLLETLGSAEERPAALTVAVPVAIRTEKPEALAHLIELIITAQKTYKKPVDVILWTNTRYTDRSRWEEDEDGEAILVPGPSDEKIVTQAAEQSYEALKEELSPLSDNNVRIRTALELYDQDNGVMSVIRGDQMQAITMGVVHDTNGSGDFLHPVLWLDADTEGLSEDVFTRLDDEIRSGRTLFPHLDFQYSLDWVDGPLETQDAATKAVAVHEYIRRVEADLDDNLGYYEESGMAMALGAYLSCGGVRQSDDINESEHLINGYSDALTRHGGTILPKALAPQTDTQQQTYLSGTYAETSARRFYEITKREGVRGLQAEYVGDGTGYELFEQVQSASYEKDASITKNDLRKLLSSAIQRRAEKRQRALAWNEEHVPSEFDAEHKAQVEAFIERLF